LVLDATTTGLCCVLESDFYEDAALLGLGFSLKGRINPCKTKIYIIP